MSSSSGSSSCKTSSGQCTFCGEYLGNKSVPIVGYGSPSTEGKGAFTKLKPLRWRFLSNKAPRTKYMCGACAEKRKVPQQFDQQLVSLDSSWSDGARDSDMLHKREDRNSKHQVSGQALKLEHLQEPRSKRQQRKTQVKQENVRVQSEKREKPQHPEHRERQDSTQEQRRSDSNSRRRGSSQTSDPTPRSSRGNVLHPFSNHRASKESIMRNRPVSTAEIDTRASIMKPRAASVDTPSRARRPSSGQPEPRRSEKKESRRSQTDPRLSSTADILGMSRSIELPPNYFAMSTTSPTLTAMSAPDQDPLARQHLEMHLPQLEPRKQNETEEERQRRRSASYAHMLMRMRRHYDAVQVNGPQGPPATAPPRRVRADRRAKSVAVRNVKDDPVGGNPAGLAIDLAYLRAYKDAR